jgi:CubicO group peptidase (beta-lactamase class C family)
VLSRLAPLALVACAATPPSSEAPPASEAQPAPELADALRRGCEEGGLHGAVALVGRGERVLAREVHGLRAVEPAPERMTADTVFDLASLTKPVATATGVLVLVDRGALDLDDPVALHLPAFAASGKEGITVEMLLRHRSGLVADNALADYVDGPELAWERLLALAPRHEPGTVFVYSDVGYLVLGRLVEALSGRSLERFVREEVLEPLGMEDAGYRPDAARRERCAPTERRDGRMLRGEVHDPRAAALGGVAGHAGLFATADDLARWCRMVLGGGRLGGTRVLSEASARALLEPSCLPDGSGPRTLGLDADPGTSARGARFPAGESFGHTGFTGTSLWLDPESGGYVVVLASRLHPDGEGTAVPLRRAAADAAAALLGTPGLPRR